MNGLSQDWKCLILLIVKISKYIGTLGTFDSTHLFWCWHYLYFTISLLNGMKNYLIFINYMHTVKNLIFALQAAPIQPEGGEVSGGDWRFELRIRYLPNDWSEVYEKDNITFMCYYNQVKDYICIYSRNRSHNATGQNNIWKKIFVFIQLCFHKIFNSNTWKMRKNLVKTQVHGN